MNDYFDEAMKILCVLFFAFCVFFIVVFFAQLIMQDTCESRIEELTNILISK